MGFELVGELRDKRSGTIERDLTRTYTRVFLVVTDDVQIGSAAVANATGIPTLYSPYVTDTESDAGALVASIEPQQQTDRTWEVNVKYTTKWEIDPTEYVENPLMRPARYRIGSIYVQEAITHDVNKTAILNSANDRFDPMPIVDKLVPTISISKNLATINYSVIRDYTNTVNSTSFAGFDKGEVKCTQITAEGPNFENGYVFYAWTVDFQIQQGGTAKIAGTDTPYDGWDLLLLDAGYAKEVSNELNQGGGGDGVDFTTPQPLDGSGDFLTRPYAADDFNYRKFQIYKSKDFNDLGLL